MGAIGYYLALPFIYGISLLPFPLLYGVSDILCLLVHRVLRYRRAVVRENLRNSFPEKSVEELRSIEARFYEWFCDLILETIKTLTISPEALRQRVTFAGGLEILQDYHRRNKSIILVMGHYGNWELCGARYSLEKAVPQLYVIYHPLENRYFDRLVHHMRTRHGTRLYKMREAARDMLRDQDLVTATAFIADQTPAPERAYWMDFLGQDTPVFLGTETLAKKLDQPVLYIRLSRSHRGNYTLTVETLVADPVLTSHGEITEIHTRRLERDIQSAPEIWLWTHRRWKHRPPIKN